MFDLQTEARDPERPQRQLGFCANPWLGQVTPHLQVERECALQLIDLGKQYLDQIEFLELDLCACM